MQVNPITTATAAQIEMCKSYFEYLMNSECTKPTDAKSLYIGRAIDDSVADAVLTEGFFTFEYESPCGAIYLDCPNANPDFEYGYGEQVLWLDDTECEAVLKQLTR